jgi:hypothetical protein
VGAEGRGAPGARRPRLGVGFGAGMGCEAGGGVGYPAVKVPPAAEHWAWAVVAFQIEA